MMIEVNTRIARMALVISLGVAVTGCLGGGTMPTNATVESVHQPVVEQTNFVLDVTSAPAGISNPEQKRLTAWFDAIDLRYGDRVSIEDPMRNASARRDLAGLTAQYGLTVQDGSPASTGIVNPGTVRVLVMRAKASVPTCTDWSTKTDTNFNNATSSNYGCSINSNLAAMIADPNQLIQGVEGRVTNNDGSTNEQAIKAVRARAGTK